MWQEFKFKIYCQYSPILKITRSLLGTEWEEGDLPLSPPGYGPELRDLNV